MLDPQLDQSWTLDAQLVGDAMQLRFFRDRDALVAGRDGEEAACQGQTVFVGCRIGELLRHGKIRARAEHRVRRLRQADDEPCLVRGKAAVVDDDRLHGARFFVADVIVGAGDAAEQVGEAGEVLRAPGLEPIQGIDDVAQRTVVGRGGRLLDSQPGR